MCPGALGDALWRGAGVGAVVRSAVCVLLGAVRVGMLRGGTGVVSAGGGGWALFGERAGRI